ncbi:MAG: Preprotein translocase subunit SecB [Syntrophorhabdus sp. PtaB.Bin047]|nr:MAG: Preprotein translocase subunit SecB [Syntrophorhabdus sp. PtaB.Bin047]
MNSSPPSLKIDQYFVDEIHVKANPEYQEPKKGTHEAKLTASMNVKRRGKLPEFMITIELQVNKSEADFKANPYYVFLRITGFFSFAKGTDEQMIEKMIPLNGLAILYGIARGVVAQATANSMHEKFILPTVNLVEATKEQVGKKVVKGSSRKKTDR